MKADTLRPELKDKIRSWIISFHRLDPRHLILTFFNLVAKHGADNMLDEYDNGDEFSNGDDNESSTVIGQDWEINDESFGTSCNGDQDKIERLLGKIFNTTGILTVWRPTSKEAMKKMMLGKGVGKALDVKGKSAKKGELAAYVPYLQIHEEGHKLKVQYMPNDHRLRVYYSGSQAQIQRQEIISKLEEYAKHQKDEYEGYDPTIDLLDEYSNTSKQIYGIEVSQSLFWKTYVLEQDISRGDDTATGRPSVPGFQDANHKTLKYGCCEDKQPRPVLLQLAESNPMSAQHLVMAYEENGTVTPVVSDFDGFLLGWKREALWFGCNLPREQEDMMMWCVKQIQKILDTPKKDVTWTQRWLDVLKIEGVTGSKNTAEMPAYGFGDPKSYGIMERAAKKMIDNGAPVRHGSECFNYYFPQEIDDHFLIISNTFKPVPWKYVNVYELQDILIEKIHQGFVFPLNPKWVLCDPGWKRVYDELMKSDALYADMARDVWFPPYSGIRKTIEEVHQKHPYGFVQESGSQRKRQQFRRYSELKYKDVLDLDVRPDQMATLLELGDDDDDEYDDPERAAEKKRIRNKILARGDSNTRSTNNNWFDRNMFGWGKKRKESSNNAVVLQSTNYTVVLDKHRLKCQMASFEEFEATVLFQNDGNNNSWKVQLIRFCDSKTVQIAIAMLFVFDILLLFVELYLGTSYNNIHQQSSDNACATLLCCPIAADVGGGSVDDITGTCPIGFEPCAGGQGEGCHEEDIEGNNDDSVQQAEEIVWIMVIVVLCIFFLHLTLEVISVGPRVYLHQFWYSLDYLIVIASIVLEVVFPFWEDDDYKIILPFRIVLRGWRFIRIGHDWYRNVQQQGDGGRRQNRPPPAAVENTKKTSTGGGSSGGSSYVTP